MSAETTRRVFRFGAFEADEATGELRKQGVRVKLHSQPFQVLILLLEKPGELVAREEIRRRLWGERTFVDFDHSLNTAVNKVRQALRDAAFEPRYVETIPGKGYRFLGPVTLAAPSTGSPVEPEVTGTQDLAVDSADGILTAPEDLPAAPRKLVAALLLLVQAMYLAFYVGALANLAEIRDIFEEEKLPLPAVLFAVLITTAAGLIPVRLFIGAAVAFDIPALPAKFRRLFPALLVVDLWWALSPFLLIHHMSTGMALGMSAALVYMPFAQRSLILMYGRGR